jgi:hypothetical protein
MAVLSYQMAIIISDYQQRPKFAETKSRKLLLSPLRYCSRAKLVGTVYPKSDFSLRLIRTRVNTPSLVPANSHSLQ